MIRIATKADIPHVAATYCELLTYEQEHGTHSNWVLDVYPTEETAETAFQKNYLYVLEEEGTICGSVILNQLQPEEYTAGTWHYEATPEQVLVIHTLCIPPSQAGKGYGRRLVQYAITVAQERKLPVIRLDTWAGNKPAATLYQNMGFLPAGGAHVLLQGLIPEEQIFFDRAITW
ncbi:GNAT family N-acetyltransferase [Megasphaera hominis]|jgi:ribosomal protein S18 acetylase RimI-like enzyme|uniref:GNAT family N-acetyltransferase n=1 Tax=Megasphaera hominis TaxID=159836 RepID=A0ABR6VFC6_9FIRM|nr:GNAT family N-acetyltransferase [Megasphaera hominis]MBC3535919.1 GNAT family N-acetyltransferase [Megasphaera hominis]